jgi:hypothetical protein
LPSPEEKFGDAHGKTEHTLVFQPIRHPPHVANGHIDVANSSVSKYLKNAMLN